MIAGPAACKCHKQQTSWGGTDRWRTPTWYRSGWLPHQYWILLSLPFSHILLSLPARHSTNIWKRIKVSNIRTGKPLSRMLSQPGQFFTLQPAGGQRECSRGNPQSIRKEPIFQLNGRNSTWWSLLPFAWTHRWRNSRHRRSSAIRPCVRKIERKESFLRSYGM